MKIFTSIASSTHLDLHGDRISKEALASMAEQINTKYIPLLVNHDWNQCIGVNLYAQIFPSLDWEYLLGVVQWVFETQEEWILYPFGEQNTVWKNYMNILNIEELINESSKREFTVEVDGKRVYEQDLISIIENELNKSDILPDGRVYITKRYIGESKWLEIHVFPKDHNPPHFHVISEKRSLNARFNLDTFEHISDKFGETTSKDIRIIQELFKNRPELKKKLLSEHARLHQ